MLGKRSTDVRNDRNPKSSPVDSDCQEKPRPDVRNDRLGFANDLQKSDPAPDARNDRNLKSSPEIQPIDNDCQERPGSDVRNGSLGFATELHPDLVVRNVRFEPGAVWPITETRKNKGNPDQNLSKVTSNLLGEDSQSGEESTPELPGDSEEVSSPDRREDPSPVESALASAASLPGWRPPATAPAVLAGIVFPRLPASFGPLPEELAGEWIEVARILRARGVRNAREFCDLIPLPLSKGRSIWGASGDYPLEIKAADAAQARVQAANVADEVLSTAWREIQNSPDMPAKEKATFLKVILDANKAKLDALGVSSVKVEVSQGPRIEAESIEDQFRRMGISTATLHQIGRQIAADLTDAARRKTAQLTEEAIVVEEIRAKP